MRGAAMHHEPGNSDPLLRAIAELREQFDRLIDEQQRALETWASELEAEQIVVARPAVTEEPTPAPLPPTQESVAIRDPEAERLAPRRVAEPAPRTRRPTPTVPSPTADPTVASPDVAPAATRESRSGARSDDPRERLSALAKHFDRKLRRSGSPPGESESTP